MRKPSLTTGVYVLAIASAFALCITMLVGVLQGQRPDAVLLSLSLVLVFGSLSGLRRHLAYRRKSNQGQ